MMELVKRILRHSAMRYLVVGGSTFALNVIILNILIVHLHWDAERVAAPAAFLLTFGVAYTLQRVFTFRSEAGVNGSMVRYAVLAGFNTLAQIPLHEIGSAFGLGTLRRQFAATAVITVWNYFAYKHWVYVDRTHPLPADEETVAWHERAVHQLKVIANVGAATTPDDVAGATAVDPADVDQSAVAQAPEPTPRRTPEVGAS